MASRSERKTAESYAERRGQLAAIAVAIQGAITAPRLPFSPGRVVPTIVDVEHLAGLFGVSPRSFLRVDAPAYDAHIQLRPIPPPIQEISAAGAVQARDRLRQVEQLVPGMKDRWLVASQGSFHLWDLDAMTYSRVPGPSSPSGPFALDLRILLITRVDSWPRVGSRSLVWFDDPADPGGVEQWRQSSRIVSITEVGGNG